MIRAASLRASVLCVACLWAATAQPATAQSATAQPAMSGPHACIRPTAAAACITYEDPYNAGCGTRGGPGCRKDNGRCAAWRDGFAPDCRQHRPAEAQAARPMLPPAETDTPAEPGAPR